MLFGVSLLLMLVVYWVYLFVNNLYYINKREKYYKGVLKTLENIANYSVCLYKENYNKFTELLDNECLASINLILEKLEDLSNIAPIFVEQNRVNLQEFKIHYKASTLRDLMVVEFSYPIVFSYNAKNFLELLIEETPKEIKMKLSQFKKILKKAQKQTQTMLEEKLKTNE